MPEQSTNEPIAIIGIGCRFPGGVSDIETYWNLMLNGTDAIVDVPQDRWDSRRFYDPDPRMPGKLYVNQAGFLTDTIWKFDAQFFGIALREAAIMDPQQRLLLETSWEALEDAGVLPGDAAGSRTGVYIGAFCFDNAFQQAGILGRKAMISQTATSSSMVMLSNRISHALDLRGPSLTVDTACSGSLVAIHLACQGLLNDECDVAIAGGVNVMLRPETTMLECKGGFLSPDARCKAFDESANGYVRGEGAGVVVLKKYSAACRAKDRIYAAISATGMNQDGRTPGLTVPNRQSQEELVMEVCIRAGISPGQICYVEAHGTGTQVGDTTEAASLGKVLAQGRNGNGKAWLGAVKTNIGHLEAAAGVAGLVKVALCLKKRRVPPNLHFNRPNPKLDFGSLCLQVPYETEKLAECGTIWAAINSFGYGGTNAHAILQSVEDAEPHRDTPETSPMLVPLSARGTMALSAAARRVARWCERSSAGSLTDLCYTLSQRRIHHPYRLAVVADSIPDLGVKLTAFAAGEAVPQVVERRGVPASPRKLVFVYSGMGAPWWGMGRQLAAEDRLFRSTLMECYQAFRRHSGPDLSGVFDASAGSDFPAGESFGRPLMQPRIAQPANLALQIALTVLWRSRGVEPDAVLGHSVGEVAAAWAAGALTLDEAARLTVHRSRLQQRMAMQGAMLAVELSPENIAPLVEEFAAGISMAALNGPASVVLSGNGDTLSEIARRLQARNVFHRFLETGCAYHSYQMDPLETDFRSALVDLVCIPPQMPLYSSVLGKRLGPEIQDVNYWWQNVRAPVTFAAAIKALEADGFDAYLEVGPHSTLSPAIAATIGFSKTPVIANSLKRGKEERTAMLEAAGKLYTGNCRIDWTRMCPEGRLVSLPAYPWQRDTFWSETKASRADRLVEEIHPLLHHQVDAPGTIWETEINVQFTPYIEDHSLWNSVVCPGAVYAVACLAAAEVTERGRVVEDLEFLRPLSLDKGALLRLHLDERDGRINVHSRSLESEAGEWSHSARARIPLIAASAPGRQVDFEDFKRRCPRSMSPAQIYEWLSASGIEYGPRFRVIREAWCGEIEVLGRLECHDSVQGECSRYGIHPTLLDGAFQLMAAAAQPAMANGTAFLPSHISRITYHHEIENQCWVYCRCTKYNAGVFESDLILCDDSGNLLAEVSGIRCKTFARNGSTVSKESSNWIYEYSWAATDKKPAPARNMRAWLVFADDGGVAHQLQAAVGADDRHWIMVRPSAQFEVIDRVFYVDVNEAEHIEQAIMKIRQIAPIEGICYLWALDSPRWPDACTTSAAPPTDAALTLLRVIQALTRNAGLQPRKLCIVTRSVHALEGREDVPDLGQASVWGLGRVIASERPELHSILVDIDAALEPSTIMRLAMELLGENDEDEIALRNGLRFVPRMAALKRQNVTLEINATDKPFALEIGSPGILDTLQYQVTQRRSPGPGEVEVEVEAAGINFKDVMKAMKLLPSAYMEETFTGAKLGMECSGTVVAVGENVTDAKIGDEVVVIGNDGAFRSHNTVSTAYMAHKPLSFEESPCLISLVTPYYGFKYVARLEKGESVLIHCATGGVGLAAVRLAQSIGATIFATAGSEEKRQYLRDLGIEHVMDSRSLDFSDEILRKTNNRGVDVVLNCLPGEALRKSIAVLANYGRFLEIGKRDIIENGDLPLQRFDGNLIFATIDTDRMGKERPQLFRRLIDEVCQLLREKALPALPVTVFPAAEVGDAFRYMARSRHIGKIVVQMRKGKVRVQDRASESLEIRENATYVITGGLGGVGMIAARLLVQKGARYLVLVSRHGAATPELQADVQWLEQHGVKVSLPQVDCAEPGELAQLFQTIQRTLPPVRGILHAAMVLDDAPLAQMSRERFDVVWRPKAQAAWNLHQCSLDLDLDFFAMFSSISALIGNVGQGNYVAANSFLDALAWYRRSRGLPAVSLAWGAIAAGVVARQPALLNHFQALGIRAFTPEECSGLLERVLKQRPVYAAILDIDWTRWRAAQPSVASRPRFSRFVSSSAQAVADPRLAVLLESALEDRQKLVEEFLCEDLSSVIHLPASKIDVQLTFENMGFDSLMIVELTTALNMRWGISLSSIENIYGQTISSVASQLLLNILKQHRPHELAAYNQDVVDRLSEEEIDALLSEMSQPPLRTGELSLRTSNA